MMHDLIPHPFASILFALVVGALFLWQGFDESRPAKRLAHVRPTILTEISRTTRLSQQIQPVPLRAGTDIKPKPAKKTYYRVFVPDSGTLEAGDVVIKLNGIVASKADAQCQDEAGKSWPCGAAAKTALRQLIRARAVVCDLPGPGEHKSFTARCAVSGTDLSTWLVRQGWAKPNDLPEPALADAAEAAKSER
jgi:endonuclease YncB( thermonuclease family)